MAPGGAGQVQGALVTEKQFKEVDPRVPQAGAEDRGHQEKLETGACSQVRAWGQVNTAGTGLNVKTDWVPATNPCHRPKCSSLHGKLLK